MRRILLFGTVLASLCLYFACPTLAQKNKTQPFEDTLTLQLGGNNRVIIPVENVRNLGGIPNIDTIVQGLNRDLSAVYDSLIDSQYATTVIYLEEPGGERILKVNTKTQERVELSFDRETGQVKRKLNEDSVIVQLENNRRLFFVLDSLSALRQLNNRNLTSLIPEASQEIAGFLAERAKKDLFPYKGFYHVTYNPGAEANKRLHMSNHGFHRNDYLRLNINMGAGLVRDKLVPELGLEAAIVFGNYRFLGLNTTFHYFFDRRDDGKYGMAINTFLNLEYAQSFNKGKWWQKFGVGYLINRQGNYFTPHTMKASLSLGTKKFEGFHLIPELIVTDNFKTAFPALRIGVGF